MKRKTIALFLLVALVAGCAAVSGQVKDPAKVALYTVNQEWIAVREYVIRGSYATPPQFSDAQVTDFKGLDDKFSLYYKLALAVYLSGTDNQAVFAQDLNQLRDILLEARRRYLPAGGK
jgi:hypothetical protein